MKREELAKIHEEQKNIKKAKEELVKITDKLYMKNESIPLRTEI